MANKESARILAMAAPTLLPILQSRRDSAYERLLGEFRQGNTNNLAMVAECNAYSSIIEDITTIIKTLDHKEK